MTVATFGTLFQNRVILGKFIGELLRFSHFVKWRQGVACDQTTQIPGQIINCKRVFKMNILQHVMNRIET